MTINFNDAEPQRGDLIPDGVFCAVKATLRPGGENMEGCEEPDLGIFKLSNRSDAVYLDFEFTVLAGPHVGRKLWQSFTVAGGKVGEDGVSKAWQITKSTFRAIIDSALGLDPTDKSPATSAKRALRGFRDLDNLEFVAKIGVKPGEPAPDGTMYRDRNVIAYVVEPTEPQWAAIRAGKEVPAAPSRSAAAPAAAAQPKPVWQQQTPAAPPASARAAAPQGPAWLRGETG
jgi:hypothetical protein